jgi:glyoxylate reductase
MKVYVCQELVEPSTSEILAGHEVVAGSAAVQGEALARAVADADAIVGTPPVRLTEAILASAGRLRIVANCAVGTDNVDLAACRARGIPVTNTPGVLTDATADLAIALVLSLARRLREAEAVARSGTWDGWRPTELLGISLAGRTLGVYGMGRIGCAVAKRAEAFGMSVRGVTSCDGEPAFGSLLEGSDVVTIHVPLTPKTRGRFGDAEFGRMRPGSLLVNTARGPIVDGDALLRALESGRLRGAGLDVFPEEPRIDPRLLPRDDVVLLPHVGSATVETRLAMARTACSEIARVFAGQEPLHPVC